MSTPIQNQHQVASPPKDRILKIALACTKPVGTNEFGEFEDSYKPIDLVGPSSHIESSSKTKYDDAVAFWEKYYRTERSLRVYANSHDGGACQDQRQRTPENFDKLKAFFTNYVMIRYRPIDSHFLNGLPCLYKTRTENGQILICRILPEPQRCVE